MARTEIFLACSIYKKGNNGTFDRIDNSTANTMLANHCINV